MIPCFDYQSKSSEGTLFSGTGWLGLTSWAAVRSLGAFAVGSSCFDSLLDIFKLNFTFDDLWSRRHNVLFHGFIDDHCSRSFVHGGESNNTVVFDVPSCKLKLIQITFNVNIIVRRSITSVVERFIPETSPEEWYFWNGSILSEHVQSCNITLINGSVNMLDSSSLTSVVVRIAGYFTWSKDVGIACLEEHISF